MLNSILNVVFGCSHERTTFPITPNRNSSSFMSDSLRNRTYVVCLDCGKEFEYNWKDMRYGKRIQAEVPAHVAAASITPTNESLNV